MADSKPVRRKEQIVVQEIDGNEVLVYDLVDDRALYLNKTSALVWRACNGENSVQEITRIVGDENAAFLALDQLKNERLIDPTFENLPSFEGVSRRQAVQKLALGAIVAIPVVASLAAPAAAQNASCSGNSRPRGCPCGSNNQCASGTCTAGTCQ